MFNIRTIDLRKFNSITKYPSIPTYHTIDPKSGVLAEPTIEFEGDVFTSEKIDGSNSRVILFGTEYIIGSRNDLLFYCNDLLHLPTESIVDTVRPMADMIPIGSHDTLIVLYMESYGKGICGKAGKAYSTKGTSYRMFDALEIPMDAVHGLLELPLEEISRWRDKGGQAFASVARLSELSGKLGIPLTPQLPTTWTGETMPKGIDETLDALKAILPSTMASIDESAMGKAEGIVVRTAERKTIAKLRFQDYERTIRKRGI